MLYLILIGIIWLLFDNYLNGKADNKCNQILSNQVHELSEQIESLHLKVGKIQEGLLDIENNLDQMIPEDDEENPPH